MNAPAKFLQILLVEDEEADAHLVKVGLSENHILAQQWPPYNRYAYFAIPGIG